MRNEHPALRVTLLGTGTSTGIPVIGCCCRVCTSTDPRDRRTRCACFVSAGDVSLVIDTGPDFRLQALREQITRLDAVLYTHHHFDHIVGMDDLRPYFFGNDAPIPCYARANTAEVIGRMFPYIFSDGTYPGVPKLKLRTVAGAFEIRSRYGNAGGLTVEPLEVYHGKMPLFGYRIGSFAYLTDVSRIPEKAMERLDGLDVLILNALRHEQHPTHLSVSEAVETAQHIGARQTYFIHMTHSMLHAEEDAKLPEGINLGYDGLTIDIHP